MGANEWIKRRTLVRDRNNADRFPTKADMLYTAIESKFGTALYHTVRRALSLQVGGAVATLFAAANPAEGTRSTVSHPGFPAFPEKTPEGNKLLKTDAEFVPYEHVPNGYTLNAIIAAMKKGGFQGIAIEPDLAETITIKLAVSAIAALNAYRVPCATLLWLIGTIIADYGREEKKPMMTIWGKTLANVSTTRERTFSGLALVSGAAPFNLSMPFTEAKVGAPMSFQLVMNDRVKAYIAERVADAKDLRTREVIVQSAKQRAAATKEFYEKAGIAIANYIYLAQ